MNLKPKTLTQAFFYANESDIASAYAALEIFSSLLDQFDEVREFFLHPRITLEQKEAWIKAAMKELKAPAGVDSFLMLLIKNGKLLELKAITEALHRIKNEALGIAAVQVESAEPVTELERGHLKTMLKEVWQAKDVEFSEVLNPELLGGAVFHMDGQVLNVSLRHKLSKVKQVLHI